MARDRNVRTVQGGLAFGEAPRWRPGDGLYVSDVHAKQILRLREGNDLEVFAQFSSAVCGSGWLPDGRMLVVVMKEQRVLRREVDGAFVVHCDLSDIATGDANDMVVDAQGVAYVGNIGYPFFPGAEPKTAKLARVSADGVASVAASDMWLANGAAITPGGHTLIVAETAAGRLSAFTIAAAGELVDRRVWAATPAGVAPDGISLDAEGAIWVASPSTSEVLRLREGGEVVERIPTEHRAFAVALGGEDQRTLFICTTADPNPAVAMVNRGGRILAVEVEVPGVGSP